jgi:hypothetical protein
MSNDSPDFDTRFKIARTAFFYTLHRPVGGGANLVIASPAYSHNTGTLCIVRISPIVAR